MPRSERGYGSSQSRGKPRWSRRWPCQPTDCYSNRKTALSFPTYVCSVSHLFGGLVSRRTGEDSLAIGHDDGAGVHDTGAILSLGSIHRDNVPFFQGVSVPTLPHQDIRTTEFKLPSGHFAFRVFHVGEEMGMRVEPLNFRDL